MILTAYSVPVALSVHTLQVEKLPTPRSLSPRLYCCRKAGFWGGRKTMNKQTSFQHQEFNGQKKLLTLRTWQYKNKTCICSSKKGLSHDMITVVRNDCFGDGNPHPPWVLREGRLRWASWRGRRCYQKTEQEWQWTSNPGGDNMNTCTRTWSHTVHVTVCACNSD